MNVMILCEDVFGSEKNSHLTLDFKIQNIRTILIRWKE